MPLSKFLKFTFSICLVLALFSSCTKDEEPITAEQNVSSISVKNLMDESNPRSNENSQAGNHDHDDDIECFIPIFPIDIVFPNGSTITIANEQQLEEEIDAYYEANPDTEEDPRPVYPITVQLGDGSDQVIENDEDFEALIIRCDHFDEEDFIICFEIEYPISIIYPDGTSQDVDSDDDLRNAIATWESANIDTEEEPTLAYPIKIFLEDGSPVTITNEEELEEAFDTCYEDCEEDDEGHDGDEFDEEDCFDVTFPITLLIGDDRRVFNSQEELDNAQDEWEQANPNSEVEVTVEYPITITYSDGSQETMNSDEELEAAYEACDDE